MQSDSYGVTSTESFSNLIDLRLFFENLADYVIIKLPDHFPNYNDYEDIDILCDDPERFCKHILFVGQQYVKLGFEIKVHQENNHFHVDLYPPGAKRLNFRFDLLASLNVYRKIVVAPQYHHIVLASKQLITHNKVKVMVPSLEHELVIRFMEYLEWKEERPDKIKHLNFIQKHNNMSFIQLINKYTNLDISVDGQNGSSLNVRYKPSLSPDNSQDFYPLASTCQIPGLAKIYEDYFGKRADGCFIEFGAFDGEYVSNTSGLADIGWRGYYIEPVPEYFERCKSRHSKNKNITVSQYAIGAESRTVTINIGGPLSTISDSMKHLFETLDWAKNIFAEGSKIQVQQITLTDYLLNNQIYPGFELLVVDVEGQEWDVFSNFDIEKWQPQMVIIELHDQNDDYLLIREQCLKLIEYFDHHGYEPLYKDSTNTVYIKKNEHKKKKQRIDYFMIWGHGLQYTNQILDIIRNHPSLEIITIVRKKIDDISQFVQDVYACDTVPFHHLIDKTRYLLTTTPEIIFVLIKNKNPQEKYFGEGAFRHIQCQLIKDIKEEIRNKYNPHRDGKRTEDHVIHASDYESQVEHVLKVLGLPSLGYYTQEHSLEIDVPYHLERIDHYELKEINIDSLYVSILERGIVSIPDTPHYHYIAGNKAAYVQYHQKHFGIELTDDHCPEAFDKMINEFDHNYKTESGKQSLIIVKELADDRYQILDGVHRASIIKDKGIKEVKVAVVPRVSQEASGLVLTKENRTLFAHSVAQEYETSFSRSWLQNNFYEKYEIIQRSIEMFMCSGIMSIGRSQTLEEFFQGKESLWQEFIHQINDKNCLEIGSGPCGIANYWHFIRKWHVIDPLATEYKQMSMEMFGKTWWWHWIISYPQNAEKLITELVGRIDGVIVCRNALDHTDDPVQVLNNIARYAAPGCKLLLWTDLCHNHGHDEGHRNITRSRELFKTMITNRGFLIDYDPPPFRDGETIEFGCVATKI